MYRNTEKLVTSLQADASANPKPEDPAPASTEPEPLSQDESGSDSAARVAHLAVGVLGFCEGPASLATASAGLASVSRGESKELPPGACDGSTAPVGATEGAKQLRGQHGATMRFRGNNEVPCSDFILRKRLQTL